MSSAAGALGCDRPPDLRPVGWVGVEVSRLPTPFGCSDVYSSAGSGRGACAQLRRDRVTLERDLCSYPGAPLVAGRYDDSGLAHDHPPDVDRDQVTGDHLTGWANHLDG